MTAAQIIELVQLLEHGVRAAIDAGLDIERAVSAIRQARDEGRLLTDDELDSFARSAADAVERL